MTVALPQRAALPGELRDDAYILPPGLPFDRWSEILTTLQQIDRSVKWWVGDAVLYGEATYGEEASQAFPDAYTGSPFAESTMRAAAWVSSKFPRGTRVEGVTWTHHRIVADLPLDDAQGLLKTAAAATPKWSTRDLIKAVDERRAVAVAPPSCAADQPYTLADLLPEWRARAEASGEARGYLSALVDTAAESCFRPGAWRD